MSDNSRKNGRAGDKDSGGRTVTVPEWHAESPAPADQPRKGGKQAPVQIARAVDIVPLLLEEAGRPKMSTGFKRLDAMVNGFRARTVTALIAGVGQGKTSFALQVAALHAETAPVVYLGLELSQPQLVARLVAQRTARAWHEVLDGALTAAEMVDVLEPLALYMPRSGGDPLRAFSAALELATSRHSGLPLVVIDYVQLMAAIGPDMRLSTMAAVREILRRTEHTDIVTWFLSQGSRQSAVKLRNGGGQSAEDFVGVGAETAAIEASAANQLALGFRKRDGESEHDVTMYVTKARLGRSGRIGYRFHGPTGLWTEQDSLPVTADQEDKRDEILDSLRAANNGPLSKNRIRERPDEVTGKKKRWVAGSKDAVNATIESLLQEGVLREQGGGYWIA